MKKAEIESILRETYNNVFLKPIEDEDQNLLSLKAGNDVIDFLYWIDALEKVFHYPVSRLVETHDYHLMTLRQLTHVLNSELNKNQKKGGENYEKTS